MSRSIVAIFLLFLSVISLQQPSSQSAASVPAGEFPIHGLAVREDTGEPVPDALVVLRTGDVAVDFAETCRALGGKEGIGRLEHDNKLTKRVRELGGWKPTRAVHTDRNGTFELTVPRKAVRFVLEGEAPGCIDRREVPHYIDDSVASMNALVILEPAPMATGRIVDSSGKPIEGAWISATKWNSWNYEYNQSVPLDRRTGADGIFQFAALPGMKPDISLTRENDPILIECPTYSPRVLDARLLKDSVTIYSIQLERGHSLRAKLIDEIGNPIKNHRIALQPENDYNYYDDSLAARTNDSGEAEWSQLARGKYRPRTLSDVHGRAIFSREAVEIPFAKDAAEPVWELVHTALTRENASAATRPDSRPAAQLTLLVRDKVTHKPIRSFVRIAVLDTGMTTVLGYWMERVEHSDNGHVEITERREQDDNYIRWFVLVRAGGYNTFREFPSLENNPTQTLVVDLERSATVRGTVVDNATGKPKGGAEVRWRTIPYNSYGPGNYATVSLADGTFELNDLPAEKIQIIASGLHNAECHSEAIELSPGVTTMIDPLKLRKGAAIRGHVVDDKHKPVGGGRLYISIAGAANEGLDFPLNYGWSADIDSDGAFYVDGLVPGKWMIRGYNSGPNQESLDSSGPTYAIGDGETIEITLPVSKE
ncbi:MAG: carboxypeptidase regulatory-like domain-containing protein [Planctomycetes bacterium]|nr:carboxypeptidase regulatory-like domain-containing protein [Planctomycetota bacterium]